MKNHIVIIGTNPPCPRCKLLTDVITLTVKELDIDADIKHLAYTDHEAVKFAKSIGLETGTAKSVADRLGELIDNNKRRTVDSESEYNKEYEDYNFSGWSYELDELLRPFETRAKAVGILMTPALVINNELKSQGHVPRLDTIVGFLLDIKY